MMKKLFKWAYGALAIISAVTLVVTFFVQDVNPIGQVTLLVQSVGFGWICGCYFGSDM